MSRACAALTVLSAWGALLGVLFAWMQSSFHHLTQINVSGPWANYTQTFLFWLPEISLWWPWALIGALAMATSTIRFGVKDTGNT